MKNTLLLLLLLISFMVKTQAQDVNDIDRKFNFEENLAPHIQFHENGYYYVTEEFLHPSKDRGVKPVLDSISYYNVKSNGDTTFRYEQNISISDENRITYTKRKDHYPSTSQGYSILETFINYEMVGDEIVQYDTLYSYLQAGVGGLRANLRTNINSQGLVTMIQVQDYYQGVWTDSYLYTFDFNEYGCLISKMEYSLTGVDKYPLYSWRNTCNESLMTSELYSLYLPFDTIEIIEKLTEFEYDELERLTNVSTFRLKSVNPTVYRLDLVSLYTYNESNLIDSISTQYWDDNKEEFYFDNILTFQYDELNNIIMENIYSYDEMDNLVLTSKWNFNFDNNFVKGDFLSGSINSELNSMLLNKQLQSTGWLIADTQYFYSGGGVNSKEKLKDINFEVYPNPSSGDLNIKISDIIYNNSQIVIRNSTGSVVLSQNAVSRNNINLANLPSGFYLVSVEGSHIRSEVKKLIIQ